MRIISNIMFVLAIVFFVLKIISAVLVVIAPTNHHFIIEFLHRLPLFFKVILHVFIATVLLLIKENPVRAISYYLHVMVWLFTSLLGNIIISKFNLPLVTFWSTVSLINIILLVNVIIQSHLIKNNYLKWAYVIQAWAMLASTIVFTIQPYLWYKVFHQFTPSRIPYIFNILTEIALIYLISKIREYYRTEYFQKKMEEFSNL